MENNTKSAYVQGDVDEISNLFARIEKFMTRITGSDELLKFSSFRPEDRKFGSTNRSELHKLSMNRSQPS